MALAREGPTQLEQAEAGRAVHRAVGPAGRLPGAGQGLRPAPPPAHACDAGRRPTRRAHPQVTGLKEATGDAVVTTRKAGKKLGVFDLVVVLSWEGSWALDNAVRCQPLWAAVADALHAGASRRWHACRR